MKHLGSSLHDFLIYIVLCSQLSQMVNTIAFKLLDRMVVGGWRDVPIDSVFPLRNFYYLSNCCIVFLCWEFVIFFFPLRCFIFMK